MKMIQSLAAAVMVAAFSASSASENWAPAAGPLQTRWARGVTPRKVWKEYPRPQMARQEWMNLNGLWEYAVVPTNVAFPAAFQGRILVPFPIESALSGVMGRLDEKSHLVYRRTLEIPRSWAGRHVLLHFGAVDWEAKVKVNGMPAGLHRGGYDPFTFDITSALKPGGAQEIIVDVYDPTEGGQARGKQVRKPNGIWYTSTSGIWQTVWLEPVPETSLDGFSITANIDDGSFSLVPDVRSAQGDENVDVTVLDHGREVARASNGGGPGKTVEGFVAQPKLWSPGHPFLYGLKIVLRRGAQQLDEVTGYFAMRKISLGRDAKGIVRPLLNNQPVFQIGTLDQGFWPDGIYCPPSDAAMRYDLDVTKQLGFNMVRKHVKVEPERWYYYCDKLGLLVWQDMPGAYLGNRTEEDQRQFEEELRAMIETHRNHPCIVQWVLFNEGWGQFDTERLAAMIKELDPTRLVDDASGWTDKKVGDIVDKHHYPAPVTPELEARRACVQGEFGGLGLAIDGHTWTKKSWGYQGMGDRKALTARYVDLMDKVLELEHSAGLCAAVYTQTTDVETECNGLMTYDREMIKPDPLAVAAANHKLQALGQ